MGIKPPQRGINKLDTEGNEMKDKDDTIFVVFAVIFIAMLFTGCFLEPKGHDPRCKEFKGRSHLACMGGHG